MVIKDEGVYVNIKGVNNVVTAINKINKEVEKELAIKMAQVVLLVGNSAKGHAAIDTGFMKANIKGSILRQRSIIFGRVTSRAPYSIHQEFPNSTGRRYKPFMRPALEENAQRIKEILGQAVMDGAIKATKNYTSSSERLL